MSQSTTPSGFEPPSGKSIALGSSIACVVAIVVLILVVLPAEYGLDPTGLGAAIGVSQLSDPVRTIEIIDVVGGNEAVREYEIPDFGQPVPLPNPAIHQDSAQPARTETMQVTIPAERETEIKTVLLAAKTILYSWQVDRGTIYSDFHGHDPELGNDFWVRYKEHQEGSGDNGSLVAPFNGEHGWYWVNYNDFPVTVTLTVTGFFEDTIDYSANFPR